MRSNSYHPQVSTGIGIDFDYDESYRRNGEEWRPRRAELVVTLYGQEGAEGQYRAVDVTLGSGPHAFYRYFPFSRFLYAFKIGVAFAQSLRESPK